MRIKLNITQVLGDQKSPDEKTLYKMLYYLEDTGTGNRETLDKPFSIKDLLKDVSQRLGLKHVTMSAELDGYRLQEDTPANQILKDGDVVGLLFKPKHTKPVINGAHPTEPLKGSRQKRESEDVVDKKKKPKPSPKPDLKSLEDHNLLMAPKKEKNDIRTKYSINKQSNPLTVSKTEENDIVPNDSTHKPSKAQKRKERRIKLALSLKKSEAVEAQMLASKLRITRVDVDAISPQAEKVNANTAKQANQPIKEEHFDSVLNYPALPLVDLRSAPPRVDRWIAYKIMELGPDYCPTLSDFKHAKVISYDADTETISLQAAPTPTEPQYGEPTYKKFEMPGTFTNLVDGVEVEYLTQEVEAVTVVPFSLLEEPRHLPW